MRNMKAAGLILDFDLYPRHDVDNHNIRCIVTAIEAGETMPPVVIDKKSKRVIDGFHRIKATLRTDGDATIAVIEKSYKNDAAMFIDAMRLNANHGAKLDSHDRAHCCIVAERLKIPMDAVAGALHMPKEKLGGLRVCRTAKDSSGQAVPLKRTMQHMAGQKLTRPQVAANERSSGMNQVFYANQIIDLIESKSLDRNDDKLLERLRHLHGLLDSLLVA